MNVSSPEIPPGFTYVLVPCDAQKPLIEHTLSDGPTDENFREKVSSYFKTTATLSTAQKEEARQHLLSCSQSDTKTNNASDQRLMGEILANRDPTFEIVPVIMPTRSNGFIGVSLYIDEVGRFKELPLNDRASKLAQRDIRGDAFLSRNEDDPCKEIWSRVSTTSTEVEDLLKNPPSAAVSSSIQNHAVTDLGGKAAESRKLTVEDIETAKEKKARGGQHFAAGDYDQADILYAEVYDALNGREDFLPDSIRASGTVPQLRQTALLNRAQCRLRLKDYAQSASFARTVLSTLNPDSIKAHYILVNSCLSLSDFDVAKEVIEHVVHTLVPQAPLDDNEKRETLDAFHRLGLELEQQRRQYHEKEKKMYANIFA